MRHNIFSSTLNFLRHLFLILSPGGFVVLSIYISTFYSLHTPWLSRIEQLFPYIILAIGGLLGWRFHRSRLAFVILMLFLSERSLYYFGIEGLYFSDYGITVLQINALLLPINIALFYFVRERGIFNLRGLARIAFILIQPASIYILLKYKPDVLQYITYQFVQHPAIGTLPFSQTVIVFYLLITLIFLMGAILGKGGPVVRGFFWALIAVMLGLLSESTGQSSTLYYCGAGLIIILSVIESAYAMAFQDELTGMPARRALNSAINKLGKRYAIAMLDIDFFKKFNDRYGHDVGDQVLCMVATHLKRVGGGGKPFRYGGEEFTVLFPGKTREDAIPHLERLRETIETSQFVLRGKDRPPKAPRKRKKTEPKTSSVSVTISIGVAEPAKTRTRASSVLKSADQALYRAKKKGRNCVSK